MAVLGVLGGRGRFGGAMERAREFHAQLERQGPALWRDTARLEAVTQRAADEANAHVTVWRADGEMLVSNAEPPLRIDASVVRTLGRQPAYLGSPRWAVVLPMWEGDRLFGYAVAEWRGPGARELWRGGAYFFGVVAALALGSIPLVRTIVSPIERLTRAVRQFGEGALGTRSGIRRRDEVGELAAAFDEMAERLERQVKTERELLANISHELRTPLSRIRVALELGAEGDPARAQRYLGEIGSDLAELERLVEDVLTAARLEARSRHGEPLPMHPSEVAVADVVREAARRFAEAWPDRALEVHVADGLPKLAADAVLLRRALDNLLDNARKYSEAPSPITLRAFARADDGRVALEVTDRGIGMSEADLQELFTPFFRSDRSRQRGTGGVGLGLVLAQRIAEAHGGTLEARSEVGKGTAFTLSLPRQLTVQNPLRQPS